MEDINNINNPDISNQSFEFKSLPPSPQSNTFKNLFFLLLGSFITILIFFIYISINTYKLKSLIKTTVSLTPTLAPISIPIPTIIPTQPPIEASIVDTDIPNQKKYTNPQAGISFTFLSKFEDMTFDVKQDKNKIYVYDTRYPYTQGQSVEFFSKNIKDSLTAVIEKQLLVGISPKDCFVEGDNSNITKLGYPSYYELKTMGYPLDPNSNDPPFVQPNKCPEFYAESNGVAYFLSDPKHPKTFIFLSIGQYKIFSGNKDKTGWENTLRFID